MEIAGDMHDLLARVLGEIIHHALGHGVVPAGLGGETAGVAVGIAVVHGGHELLAIGVITQCQLAGQLAAT